MVNNKVTQTLTKRWRRHPILELANYNHDSNTPMKQFIYDVFYKYNKNINNYTLTRNSKKQVSTYNSKRSLIDLYGLCRNYYPGSSLEEMCRHMFELVKENKIYGRWFCSNINRYVFSEEPPYWESHNIRKDRLSVNGDLQITDLLEELGYSLEDFRIKRW